MAKHRGQFKKGGGRIGTRRRARRTRTRTRTVTKTRRVYVGGGHHRRRRSHRRHHGAGGVGLKHLALAGAGLALLTGSNSPVKAISDNAAKIPGAKTFGPTAVAGLACLGVDRFIYKNRWLRAAGYAGILLAAVQVGDKNKTFSWVGDESDLQLRGGEYTEAYDGQVEGFDDDDDEVGDPDEDDE